MGSLLLVILSAAEVSLTVAPDTACVSQEGLTRRLERAGVAVSKARSELLHVELVREGVFIRVKGLRSGGTLERKVSASVDDCASAERLVAALIQAWAQTVPRLPASRSPRSLPPDAGVPSGSVASTPANPERAVTDAPGDRRPSPSVNTAPGASQAGEASGSNGSAATQNEPAGTRLPEERGVSPMGAVAGARLTEEQVSPTSASAAAATPSVLAAAPRATSSDRPMAPDATSSRTTAALGAPTLGTPPTDPAAVDVPDGGAGSSPPEPRLPNPTLTASIADAGTGTTSARAPSLALDVFLGGGTSIGHTPAFTGAGQMSVALSGTRLGAMADLGLESVRAATQGSVSVSTAAQWLSLSGFLRFQPASRLGLRTGAGVRGWRLGAEAAGVTDQRAAQVFSVGGALWADASLRVAGPLSLTLGLAAAARFRPERFVIDGLGTVLELSPFSATALLGLSIHGLGE